MYKVHQDATMLPLTIESEDYEYNDKKIPSITSSASQTNNGDINISLANVNPNKDIIVDIDLRGIANFANVKGEIITSEKMNDYNDFGKPEKVNIKSFSNFKLENKKLTVTLPSKSVVTINLK